MNNPDVTEKLKTPAASTPASGLGYVEVKTIEVKIGDEFWCPHTKRWLPVEVRTQQMGVCIGGYLVRRKIQKASSPNTPHELPATQTL